MVAGDFNAVRSIEDRRNTNFEASSTRDLNEFIKETGLHEFCIKGNRFTYF